MDADAEYAQIIREAIQETAAAQSGAYPVDANHKAPAGDLADRLAGKARELGSRLRKLLPSLEASGCSVSVTAFPPSINVSVSRDRDHG